MGTAVLVRLLNAREVCRNSLRVDVPAIDECISLPGPLQATRIDRVSACIQFAPIIDAITI